MPITPGPSRSKRGKRRFEVWMYIPESTPKKLARLLVIKGISQRGLAAAVGWRSKESVARILRRTPPTIPVQRAMAIADFLEVDVYDLFLPRTSRTTEQIVRRKRTAA